jgi:hypothetical protein
MGKVKDKEYYKPAAVNSVNPGDNNNPPVS